MKFVSITPFKASLGKHLRIHFLNSSLFFMLVGLFLLMSQKVWALPDSTYISHIKVKASFPLTENGVSTPLYVNESDFPGVLRAARDLQKDIFNVTHLEPDFFTHPPASKRMVVIGTIGKSPLIDRWIKAKKLNVSGISGKWETYLIQVIEKPMPGVDQALVIAGSDKRGTIYGIYDVSAKIGVSPWYWWADVPIPEQKTLYVLPGRYSAGEPKVQYRGIFINDEAPAFSGWAKEKFNGVNHLLYAHMFELLLRLKANYLWPAMWGNAFNDDDSLNRKTANDYGIVMGTSHHEPMDRAQQEWKRYGTGAWDYEKNGKVLRNFWKKGIENMGKSETLVTVGMRGDGDMAMTEGTNIALLENIVKDQRKIIGEVTGKAPEKTPQVWALYKEVQEYYDKGMRVPDDITLLLCDDNWGDIRKLPALNEKPRTGGYGIYYHFDYVGGPRNYKWINTNPIPKVWEQMHQAYLHQVKKVWIVNVGDLKPMEFPISFFLDYAWNPDKIGPQDLKEYIQKWTHQQFGSEFAAPVADILSTYTKFNGRRKPELINEETFSLVHFNEFERVVKEYRHLNQVADSINKLMPLGYKDAYYELVLYPVQAASNLYELYYATALNHQYALQGRSATQTTAEKVKELFKKDADISSYYNNELAGGKWSHMMDQTHIGYTYWQQPPVNKMPWIVEVKPTELGSLGVAVEGNSDWWPQTRQPLELPVFNNLSQEPHFIELFNRGNQPIYYSIQAPPYVSISQLSGNIENQDRIGINIDWQKVPDSVNRVKIKIQGSEESPVVLEASLKRISPPQGNGFVQTEPYISMEAAHFQSEFSNSSYLWTEIPDYGRTLSGMTLKQVGSLIPPVSQIPHLEYEINLLDTGTLTVHAYMAPTIDFTPDKSLHYSISIDDEAPIKVPVNSDSSPEHWNQSVSNNINILSTYHRLSTSGHHILKFWMPVPGIVLEKLVIDTGKGLKTSYLGPPESFRK